MYAAAAAAERRRRPAVARATTRPPAVGPLAGTALPPGVGPLAGAALPPAVGPLAGTAQRPGVGPLAGAALPPGVGPLAGAVQRIGGLLTRLPVTAGYLAALALVAALLAGVSAATRQQVVLSASTNLDNLGRFDLLTLLTSAFVGAGGSWPWWLGLVAILAGAELLWGGRRLVATFLAGHVGATLVVAAGLVVGIRSGWLPARWTDAADVGVSYGTVAIAGALTLDLPRRLRPVWTVGGLPSCSTRCSPTLRSPPRATSPRSPSGWHWLGGCGRAGP